MAGVVPAPSTAGSTRARMLWPEASMALLGWASAAGDNHGLGGRVQQGEGELGIEGIEG